MKALLKIAALGEAGTGLVLLIDPSMVTGLLFAADVTGTGTIIGRIAGICLIALGVACWPSIKDQQALHGMLTYSVLAMLYLIVIGMQGGSGILLWPGVLVHAVLCVLLVRERLAKQKTKHSMGANSL